MNIKEIEDKIIERLKSAKTTIQVDENTTEDVEFFAGFDVDSFPAKFEDYSFLSPVGCLLTQYLSTNYAKNKTIGMIVQDKEIKFNLFMALRYLSKHNEAYPFIDKVEELLTGFKVDEDKQLILQTGQYLDGIDKDLWYGFTFVLADVNIENADKRPLSELDKIYPDQTQITTIKQLMSQGGIRK